MKNVYSIFEYQTICESDFLEIDDFKWLLDKIENQQMPCFKLGIRSGKITLKATHYLAVISLPSGMGIEILPKISKNISSNSNETREWVTKMLSDIYGLSDIKICHLPVLADLSIISNKAMNMTWLEPLIYQWYILISSLELPKIYDQSFQNSPQAQGKLIIKEQIKHNQHRPHYRFTSQQQFVLNTLWLRFFYTTLQKIRLLNISILPDVIQSLMTILKNLNQNVSNKKLITLSSAELEPIYYQLKQSLQHIRLHGINSKYYLSQALDLSWLILQIHDADIPMPLTGNNQMPAIIFDMNKTFENWVSLKLISKFQQTEVIKIKRQVRSTWLVDIGDSEIKRHLQPDLLILEQLDGKEKISIVVDIKYKAINSKSDIKTIDLYQIHTYQQHWNAKWAYLIYPKTTYFDSPFQFKSIADNSDIDLTSASQIWVIPFDVVTGELII